MTKKHFIALADYVKARPNTFDKWATLCLAEFCQNQNPRFNRTLWLNYIASTCGPNGGKVKVSK